MALLSSMIRSAAITGRTDYINAWFGGRQGGRWATQTVLKAVPTAAPPGTAAAPAAPASAPETLRELTDLRERGVVTDAEFEDLRGRLGV